MMMNLVLGAMLVFLAIAGATSVYLNLFCDDKNRDDKEEF